MNFPQKKKSLFDENDRYTNEALDIENEFSRAIVGIIQSKIEQGYSAREIEYLAHKAATDIVLMELIDRRAEEMQNSE